jgi:protein-disulfide isomerase
MTRVFLNAFLVAAVALGGILAWNARATGQPAGFDARQVGDIERIVREYLLANPEILREVLTALEEKEQQEREDQVAGAIEDYRNDILSAPASMVLGNPEGDVTLVEFFDYNCGYCKRAVDDLAMLLETDPNLRVVLKEFPILSEGSVEAAKGSVAAANQGRYRDFHFGMLRGRGVNDGARALQLAEELGLDMERFRADMKSAQTEELITGTQTLASEIGIQGTPAYIVGSTLVPGAIGVEGLREVIAETRATN